MSTSDPHGIPDGTSDGQRAPEAKASVGPAGPASAEGVEPAVGHRGGHERGPSRERSSTGSTSWKPSSVGERGDAPKDNDSPGGGAGGRSGERIHVDGTPRRPVTLRPDDPLADESLRVGLTSVWATTRRGDVGELPSAEMRTSRLRRLGVGGQGEVWLVKHLGQLEAHKMLGGRGGSEREFFREALHTRLVKHPNIVQVFGTEDVEGAAVLRMEYVEGRDLARHVDEVGILAFDELIPLAVQIADALEATHRAQIVHQDLKPSNLILRESANEVVVTDFGVSAASRAGEDDIQVTGGTPLFMAPELFSQGAVGTPSSDLWSLGVTLYYLACGAYPFPFDTLPPPEAVREGLIDPRPEHPHLADELWGILRRLLRADAGREYQSMAEVRDELAGLLQSFPCPRCSAPVPLDAHLAPCPNPGCATPDAVHARSALRARRRAESALARCEFAAARSALKEAPRQGLSPEVREGLQRLERATERLSVEHGRAVEEVDAYLQSERWIDAVRRLEEARRVHSRSELLLSLRARVRKSLGELHRGVEDRVREGLRRGDFEGARGELEVLHGVLDNPDAARELRQGTGGAADRFGWLADEIERREAVHGELKERSSRAIEAFRFDEALRETTRFESEFPSERNVEVLRRLQRAKDAYALVRPYTPDRLAEWLDEPTPPTAEQRADLRGARDGCATLLREFPPEEYPSYRVIEERRDLLVRVIANVRSHVSKLMQRADEAESRHELDVASECLESAAPFLRHCDLYDSEIVQEFEERWGTVRELIQRGVELYREGELAFEHREYARADLFLRELENLAPADYPEVTDRLAEIEALRGKIAQFEESFSRDLATIRAGDFTLDSIELALERSENLHLLVPDERRREIVLELRTTTGELLASQIEYLEGLGASDALELQGFLDETLARMLAALPLERWVEILEPDPALRERFARLLELSSRRARPGLEFSGLLAEIEPLIASLEGMQTLVTLAASEPGSPSAALTVAQEVEDGALALGSGFGGDAAQESQRVLRRLAPLIPEARRHELHRRTEHLRRLDQRRRYASGTRWLLRGIAVATPLLAIAWFAYERGNEDGVIAMESVERVRQEEQIEALGLGEVESARVLAWYRDEGATGTENKGPTTSGEVESAARREVLFAWRRLRSGLADLGVFDGSAVGSPDTASVAGSEGDLTWGSFLALAESNARGPGGDLAPLHDRDLARLIDAAWGFALDRALSSHGESFLGRDSAHGELQESLAELERAVVPDGVDPSDLEHGDPRRQLVERAAAVGSLVAESLVDRLDGADGEDVVAICSDYHSRVAVLCDQWRGGGPAHPRDLASKLESYLLVELRSALLRRANAHLEAVAAGTEADFDGPLFGVIESLDRMDGERLPPLPAAEPDQRGLEHALEILQRTSGLD